MNSIYSRIVVVRSWPLINARFVSTGCRVIIENSQIALDSIQSAFLKFLRIFFKAIQIPMSLIHIKQIYFECIANKKKRISGQTGLLFFNIRALLECRVMLKAFLFSVSLFVGFVGPLRSQTLTLSDTPKSPTFNSVDTNGVDLLTGMLHVRSPELSMGSKDDESSFFFTWTGQRWIPNTPSLWVGVTSDAKVHYYISADGSTYDFSDPTELTRPNIAWGDKYFRYKQVSPNNNASLLCYFFNRPAGSSWVSRCEFDSNDGLSIVFNGTQPSGNQFPSNASQNWGEFGNTATWPSCMRNASKGVTHYWDDMSNSSPYYGESECGAPVAQNTNGTPFSIRYPNGYYVNRSVGQYYNNLIKFEMRYSKFDASATNRSLIISTPNLLSSGASIPQPLKNYLLPNATTQTISDGAGKIWKFVFSGMGDMVAHESPVGVAVTYTYDLSHRVKTVSKNGYTWNYSYNSVSPGGAGGSIVTDPYGKTTTVYRLKTPGPVTAVVDPLNRVTNLDYDAYDRLIRITFPEQSAVGYLYNVSGDLTKTVRYPKPDSGLLNIERTLSFDPNCASNRWCHRPLSVTDENGNTTLYEYNPTFGLPSRIAFPLTGLVGTVADMKFTYTQQPVYFKDSSGAVQMIATTPLSGAVLSEVAICQSIQPCTGTLDEVKDQYSYSTGFEMGSALNNRAPKKMHRRLGNNALLNEVTWVYDEVGNLVLIDGPRSDVDDRQYATFDALRRPMFEVAADPDGAGPLLRPVKFHVYDAAGKEVRTDYGLGFASDGSDFVRSRFRRMIYSPTTGLLLRVEDVTP